MSERAAQGGELRRSPRSSRSWRYDRARDDCAAAVEAQLKQLKEELAQLTRVTDNTAPEIARQNAATARRWAGERSHARQIEDLGRVGRIEEEHKRHTQRREELDEEIRHSSRRRRLAGSKAQPAAHPCEAAEERVKDPKPWSAPDKEVDHPGRAYKSAPASTPCPELAARHEGFSLRQPPAPCSGRRKSIRKERRPAHRGRSAHLPWREVVAR